MIKVREERPEDFEAVRRVNELAFGRPEEASLVEALRTAAEPHVSLVAEVEGRVVGHIFFSPVMIESEEAAHEAIALGPMAVLPEFQGRGVGSRLVLEGLEECRRRGHGVVFVLGHPEFYPRFGFAPTKPRGITCEYQVPAEVFMLKELREGALAGRAGVVKYHEEFGKVE